MLDIRDIRRSFKDDTRKRSCNIKGKTACVTEGMLIRKTIKDVHDTFSGKYSGKVVLRKKAVA